MYRLLPIAILPGIILGSYIYFKDKKEKEPPKLLLKLFLSGILAAIVAVALTYMMAYITKIDVFEVDYHNPKEVFIHAFVVVALIEETSKWLFTYIITRKSKEYNYSFDIIVYSAFVSLGFASLENIIYAIACKRMDVVLIRAITTVPAHIFFSIFMGYFLLRAKKFEQQKPKIKAYTYKILSVLCPTILHGFFDFCIMLKKTNLTTIFLIFIGILYITSYLFLENLSITDTKL